MRLSPKDNEGIWFLPSKSINLMAHSEEIFPPPHLNFNLVVTPSAITTRHLIVPDQGSNCQ
ncbi:MAG: hypothetical protein EWV83_13640 [Microcystis sp. M_OC_Ca_00000000_S217Cul]|uniref:Uncharacterized protein n=2 Tax=Microcystis TaxID=1125 RepID=A0A552ERD2_MICAE|nr:hypothetical protein [Microcystis aeruginosa F13-15]TRT75264.1 MAG: hypothetical protein EWV83_13640 [Microcystis sp. M_OC_Ca_00000000_S217Cul]TRT86534.1 MAG: hypothetical protein EWV66_16020 [Microcystis sp. M_OC_Ca_00000000_C217Col]TRU37022.1 MAG: hypothetical protein EWV78_07765 [Microcystis aeruginosa Ma_MB_F_20061100_S20D]TRU40486.1 MAG: hypothetical protein EWV50_07970 [Microcystis aeruginosa Ma_MB_F_20061100_S20]